MKILRKIGAHFREKQYYYVCTAITFILLILGFFRFSSCLGRLWESLRDFGLSIAYAFCDWFDIGAEITPTVNEYSAYLFLDIPPLEWETLQMKWTEYWTEFVNTDNMIIYLYYVIYYSTSVAPVVMFAVPLWFALKRLFNKYYLRESKTPETDEEKKDETRPIENSKPLRGWHWLYFTIIVKIENWFIGLYDFVRERKELYQSWLLLVCLYFNAFTIFFEFLAYYIYFSVSLDLINLYRQGYKLLVDLSPLLSVFGVASWTTVVILALRKKSKDLEIERMMNGVEEE